MPLINLSFFFGLWFSCLSISLEYNGMLLVKVKSAGLIYIGCDSWKQGTKIILED